MEHEIRLYRRSSMTLSASPGRTGSMTAACSTTHAAALRQTTLCADTVVIGRAQIESPCWINRQGTDRVSVLNKSAGHIDGVSVLDTDSVSVLDTAHAL